MVPRFYLILIILVSCKDQKLILDKSSSEKFCFVGARDKTFLKQLNMKGLMTFPKVEIRIWYNQVLRDTCVSFFWSKSEMEIPVDSIYYVSISRNYFSSLVKTKFANPILYFQSDTTGNYKVTDDLGDYVSNISLEKGTDSTFISFATFSKEQLDMTYRGICRISYSNNNLGFNTNCKEINK